MCINCKWCNLSDGVEYAKCDYVILAKVSLIDNKPLKQQWTYCDTLRGDKYIGWLSAYIFGICGPQGRFFEPKGEGKTK